MGDEVIGAPDRFLERGQDGLEVFPFLSARSVVMPWIREASAGITKPDGLIMKSPPESLRPSPS